jgi:hypothetical protein
LFYLILSRNETLFYLILSRNEREQRHLYCGQAAGFEGANERGTKVATRLGRLTAQSSIDPCSAAEWVSKSNLSPELKGKFGAGQ